MGCLGFRIFRTEPGTGPWDRLERRKYSRSDNSVEKIYDRTEVLLPGRAVPRCHGCAETKQKNESFRLRIENPITPSPPSLRSFLLSVVSSRSAACRRATTTAGRGRRHRQDHDHQYDVHHIVLVRLVILFVFSLPFLCFNNKCGRGKRDFPVSFCSWWICDLGLWLFFISQLLLQHDDVETQTNALWLYWILLFSSFVFKSALNN